MTARALSADLARSRAGPLDPGALGSWALGFSAVGYLAMSGGGYDVVVRSQVGIAAWWIVLVGAALGVLPQQRIGRGALAAVGLLAALAGWSALSATWSETPERAISETARIVTLVGLLMLAAGAVRARHVRPLLNGVFAAIASIAVVACVSRLHPAWFPVPETAEFLPRTRSRLSYPVNYWNGLAALVAMALPLGLAVAMTARTLAGRTAALATLPVLVLTGFFTLSRGGILATVVGLAIAFVLTAERGRWLAKLALAAAAAAILVKGALQRDALRDGLANPLAHHQGDELLVVLAVVIAGVALAHVGLSMARTGGLIPGRTVRLRSRVRAAWGAVAAAVALGLVVTATSGAVRTSWEEFKNPELAVIQGHSTESSRLGSASGTGRYQYWVSAVHAFESDPLTGIGAGSFETWWARHATLGGTIRNAHSLYAETLGELGIIGLVLVISLIVLVVAGGVRSVRRTTGPAAVALAGITGACTSFAVSAGIDWVWQVTVLPACFVLLGVALLPPRAERVPRMGRTGSAGMIGLALAGLIALAVPLAGAIQLRASHRAMTAERLGPALGHAASAGRVQPYASSPALQEALVLEAAGDLDGAVSAARRAEAREPTNWRAPFVLARLETERGRVEAALVAYRRAKSLNRESSFLR